MRALFRPSTLVGNTRIPSLDEDEATMAVAAARYLFHVRKVEPAKIQRLECVSDTAPKGWSSHVQVALGLSHATIEETGQGAIAPGTLRFTANAVRPGSADFGKRESVAIAEVVGDGKDIDASAKATRTVDAAFAEKIAQWETRAPNQFPMGAYIPKSTWDSTLEARYRLVAGFCGHCRRGHLPRVDPCPVCGRPTERRELLGPGSLYTFTSIAAGGGPTEFDPLQNTEGKYGVGIVDFGDRIRVAAPLTETDLGKLAIGQKMEPVFRRIYAQEGAWRYGTKFRAVQQ